MTFRFSGPVAVGCAMWLAVTLLGCGGGSGGGENSGGAGCGYKCNSSYDCYHPSWGEPCSYSGSEGTCAAGTADAEWCPGPAPPPAPPAPPNSGGAGCDHHCSAPDNCYHPSWGAPCSQAGSESACTGSSSSARWCPGPAPVPPPCPSPPTPSGAAMVGYWIRTWHPTCVPLDANFTVAFSGWANVSKAMGESVSVLTAAVGDVFFALGGGNEHGAFTTDLLRAATDAIINDELQAWTGLALDVEYCNASGLAPSFQDVLAAAKSKGMKTMVTVSHTAPVGCPDQAELMTAFFQDTNIDFLSPQLYTNGEETSPDFAETDSSGVSFNMYKSAIAAFLPSIVSASQFEAVAAHFPDLAVEGFVQWSQAVAKSSSLTVMAV